MVLLNLIFELNSKLDFHIFNDYIANLNKMVHTILKFNVGKKKHRFNLVHNLDDMGLDIEAALINWSVRTNDFSVRSFIEYVRSKDPLNIFMTTKKYFDELEATLENR